MNILITGGAGFIGSHLADRLLALGHQVYVLDNLSTGSIDNLPPQVKILRKDLFSIHIPNRATEVMPLGPYYLRNEKTHFTRTDYDYIFHLAANVSLRFSLKNPELDAKVNIVDFLEFLTSYLSIATIKPKKIIFASTGGAIYHSQAPLPWTEDTPCLPQSGYGISKLTTEHYLRVFQQQHDIPYVSLRYANVYGPRQNGQGEAGVIAIFKEKLQQQKPLTIFGDGEQTRDFIYVSDIVEANILAMQSEIQGIFNVGTGIPTSINQLANLLGANNVIYKEANPGEVLHSYLDSSKLQQYGWKPTISLQEGLKKW